MNDESIANTAEAAAADANAYRRGLWLIVRTTIAIAALGLVTAVAMNIIRHPPVAAPAPVTVVDLTPIVPAAIPAPAPATAPAPVAPPAVVQPPAKRVKPAVERPARRAKPVVKDHPRLAPENAGG